MKKVLILLCFYLVPIACFSEPYFAVKEGLACSSCHSNPTGGGLRNTFGNIYAQNSLPQWQLPTASSSTGASSDKRTPAKKVWTGEVSEYFSVGGNARYSSRQFDIDNRDDSTNLGIDRTSLYLNVQINEFVSLYVDQQVAPGGSLNRESWVKINYNNMYLKAGKMFLPFGWRIEDDSAFIRSDTGINFNSADNGVEFGYIDNAWSFQLAVSNGTSGSSEVDDGKQISMRLARIYKRWQIGLSANNNDTDFGERQMSGVFVGLNTGPVTWLAEWDQIDDKDFSTLNGEQDLALLEANYRITKGHNLKLTYETKSFDDQRENQQRYSAVWEFFPIPYTQFRLGIRERDSDAADVSLNGQEVFAQLHMFF